MVGKSGSEVLRQLPASSFLHLPPLPIAPPSERYRGEKKREKGTEIEGERERAGEGGRRDLPKDYKAKKPCK